MTDIRSGNSAFDLIAASAAAAETRRRRVRIRNFGVDGRTREAVVTFDAALQREAGKQVDKRRFEARVPVAEITPGAAAVALNQAANQVAGEIADWIGR